MKYPDPASPRCSCGEVLSCTNSRISKAGDKVRAFLCRECGQKWRSQGDGPAYPAVGRNFSKHEDWDFAGLLKAFRVPEEPITLPGVVTGYNFCLSDEDDVFRRRASRWVARR